MECFSFEQPLCDYNESMDALPLWDSNSFDSPIGDDLDGQDPTSYSQDAWSSGLNMAMISASEVETDDGLSNCAMVILRDRLITDAALNNRNKAMETKSAGVFFQSLAADTMNVPVKSEHSYNIFKDMNTDEEMADKSKPVNDQELTSKFCNPISLNVKLEPTSAPSSPTSLATAQEEFIPTDNTTVAIKVEEDAKDANSRLLLTRLNAPNFETNTGTFILPPTPPSSSSSDSEGCLSPFREATSPKIEPLPNDNRRISPNGRVVVTKAIIGIDQINQVNLNRQPINSPLISHQPKGSTGTLQLTEEEKRTLLAEGYAVPTRLPLTKAEEKSLKKIRRKIKNKISAQESRRKKKEYMDTLERRATILADENADYRHRLRQLEADNVSLQHQLQRFHQLLNQSGIHLSIATEEQPKVTPIKEAISISEENQMN